MNNGLSNQKKYMTILADPPWNMGTTGLYERRKLRLAKLVYPLMSTEDIKKLRVADYAEIGCHLWLWVTNSHLHDGFDVMAAWGFKYLAPITWVKPSGLGNYFIHRTQHLLFGYRDKCIFPKARYKPTVFMAKPKEHSQKPEESYELIESISPTPRLELFARQKRKTLFNEEWDVWGNEVKNNIILEARPERSI